MPEVGFVETDEIVIVGHGVSSVGRDRESGKHECKSRIARPGRRFTDARMKSMTGFGRAEIAEHGLRCAVELTSVNRKQSDIEIRLPREWNELEAGVRKLVAGAISRGRLQVQITLDGEGESGAALHVDHALARQYADALRKFDAELFGSRGTTADALLRAPGVFTVVDSASRSVEHVQPLMETAVAKALVVWDKARVREGTHLKKDIEMRLKVVRDVLKGILREAPRVAEQQRDAMRKRLADAGLPLPLDDERLLKEIAIFADKSDISEEISRLGGHLDEFTRLLKSAEPSGRAMDFLTQEMHREINTMGSKANNAGIAHLVVAGKTEVERIREQVQNVE
jgi:uncharacterized protein (TIGR00255 family)